MVKSAGWAPGSRVGRYFGREMTFFLATRARSRGGAPCDQARANRQSMWRSANRLACTEWRRADELELKNIVTPRGGLKVDGHQLSHGDFALD
jgi:hypothetical protein